jgi:predicted enzyme related to lactoylglutathione lyase
MTSVIRHLSIDCAEPFTVATFWSGALRARMNDDDMPGDQECAVHLPEGNFPPRILFLRVPDARIVKNRLHLDIEPSEGATRAEEVERLTELGATLIRDHLGPSGLGWTVMTDPEGNEFCVESSADEVAKVRAANPPANG